MSQFFKVLFRHSPKEDGKYRHMETVYHLHGDTDGYDNHRCVLMEDGKYFCPGCKQSFNKEEINRYPYRDLPNSKSYWLESRRSGQHLPHNEKDVFWTHMHPQDDIQKKKVGEVDFSGIFASCQACDNILNLHTWQESQPDKKQLFFPGIVMENISISIWKELKIFLEENVEIWLQDKDGKFFFLSNQLQLLPAENQEGILVCGDRLFLDNDDRKCLLFQMEKISQEMIDENLKEKAEPIEDFHLEIKMAAEAEIPKRPESRRRSTKELSSGELAGLQTPPEREQSQEIIVIVNGEHAETHKIPKHYKVNLDEPMPLPEDAHPLLIPDLSDTNVADSCGGFAPMELAMTDEPKMVLTIEQAEASGLLVLPDIANEPTMAITEAPTAAVPTVMEDAPAEPAMTDQPDVNVNPAETPDPLETANADIDENAMTAESGMLGNQLPDFTADENNWFSTGEKEVDQKKLLKEHARTQAWLDKLGKAPNAIVPKDSPIANEPTMALTEAPTAAVPTVTEDTPAELAMTEQPGTDVENTNVTAAEAEPATATDETLAKLETTEAENANVVIDQPLTQNLISGTISINTDVANEPTMALADAPTAAVPTVTEDAPAEPAMTESVITSATDDPSPEPIPASEGTRQCIICGKMLQSSRQTGEEICDEHEKSCFICATVNPQEAIFCGGCGSPFTKKTKKPAATTPQPELKNVLTKIGLAVGMVGILVFVPMVFSWLINYFQSEDLKAELRAAEKSRMELSSQTNKLRVQADLVHFDLQESKRDLQQVRNDISTVQAEQQHLTERQTDLNNRLSNALSWEADLHAYFVKEKNLFCQYLAELGKNLRDEYKNWQVQERERSEQRYAELVKQIKSLATEARKTPVTPPSLFGYKPEQDKAETVVLVKPAKSFLDELMPALIELNKQLAKKYRDHKKAPPTLVVDKTPVTASPQKPTQNTPPAVHKSVKDKVTAPVDKSKKPQKSAEKTPKNPQKTETLPTFEAKDLVHVWTGPTYF